jgi:hypothetical protein
VSPNQGTDGTAGAEYLTPSALIGRILNPHDFIGCITFGGYFNPAEVLFCSSISFQLLLPMNKLEKVVGAVAT